jgi:hypothetical protein
LFAHQARIFSSLLVGRTKVITFAKEQINVLMFDCMIVNKPICMEKLSHKKKADYRLSVVF